MNPNNKEKRVINIDKDAHDIIKEYCDKYAFSMNKWITMILLEKIELDKKTIKKENI